VFSNNDVKLIVSTLTLLIVTTLGSAVAHEDVEPLILYLTLKCEA